MKTKISRILGVGVTLALLTSLLVGALPASALSTPTVSIAFGQNIISQVGSQYTVRVTVDQELGNTDTITLTFPSDTVVAGGAMTVNTGPGEDINVQAEDGWVGGVPNTPAILAAATAAGGAGRTITLTLGGGDQIGEGAEVRFVIDNVLTNPTSPGDYTLTAKTSQEPTATTSNVYAIVPPSLYYPGNIEIYNPSGYLMGVQTSFMPSGPDPGALALCTTPGYTLKVGTGYYDEIIVINQQVTIEAMDGATPVIADLPNAIQAPLSPVGGTIVIAAPGADKTAGNTGVILDGLTIMGNTTPADPLTILAEGVTVQNCTFTKAGSSATTGAQNMIWVADTSPTYSTTISNCVFDMGLGSVADTGVHNVGPNAKALVVTGCTFTADGAPVAPFYTQDYCIDNNGGLVSSSSNTATGTFSGTFARVYGGGITISTNDTMTGLWRALRVGEPLFASPGTLSVSGASISGCGIPASSVPPLGVPAVDVYGGPTQVSQLTVTNSSITNSYGYAFNLQATADWDLVNVMFNTIENTHNVYSAAGPVNTPPLINTDPLGANFSHNWWGDPDGPAADSLGYATSSTTNRINTGFPMGAPHTGDVALNTANYTSTTTGVTVTINESTTVIWWASLPGVASPAGIVGAAQYESNPTPVDPMYPVIDDGFLDIFVGAPWWLTDVATITIPNANIGADTIVAVWNPLIGDWMAAEQQGVNAVSGKIWFKAGPGVWPEIGDLAGTPIALLTAPEPPLAAPAQGSLVPAQSATGISTTLTSFSWDAVAGADSYNFQLAPYFDVVDPFTSAFIILETNVPTNGVILVNEELEYYETYAWRVQAVSGDETSAWVTSFFVTEAEPEEAPDPIEIVIPEPTPTPEIEVVVPAPTEVEILPEYLLWVIVGVAAVLIIAVIVLIVRTRRVA